MKRLALCCVALIAILPIAVSAPAGGATSNVLGTPHPATGSPVKIGYDYEGNSPALDTANELTLVRATVKYANAYLGGIGGHPIQLDVCANLYETAQATTCANQFVQDGVPVVVSGSITEGASMLPAVNGAGIPWFGFIGSSAQELTDPLAFSETGAIAPIAGGPAEYMMAHGIKHAGVFVLDTPSAVGAMQAIAAPAFKKAHLALDIVPIPATTADMTPQVNTELANKPNALWVVGSASFCESALIATKTLSFTGTTFLVAPCLSSAGAKAIPGGFKGDILQTNFDVSPKTSDVHILNAIISKYAPGTSTANTALNGYSGMLGFIRAMKGLTGPVTKTSVVTKLESAKNVPQPLGDGITFSCGSKPIALLPSACSTATLMTPLTASGTATKYTKVDPTPLFKP